MTDLSRIGDRGRLMPRKGDEPHWQRLRPRCYLGYRPSRKDGAGTWFARAFNNQTNKYLRKPLGNFGDLTGHEVFTAAKREAEAWADEVESGGVIQVQIFTVRDACEAYIKAKPGKIAEGVFRRHVYEDPVGLIRLDRLRRSHLREWRKRLEDAPAHMSRNKSGKRVTKKRAPATVNRDIVPLRAALNRVLAPGKPATEADWQEALKPAKGAGKPRTLYLDPSQRKNLLAALPFEIEPFFRAMCMLPIRVGALANLRNSDLEQRTRTLTIGKDKAGRARQIALPIPIAEFLAKQAKGRNAADPMFSRSDGEPWNRNTWKTPIKEAAAAAKLPPDTTAYTLRHSVITDLVMAGVPLFVVARLAGTGVQMIEDHYGHLVRDVAEEALKQLVL